MNKQTIRRKPGEIEAICELYESAAASILKEKGPAAVGMFQKALKSLEDGGAALDRHFYLSMLFPWADLFWTLDRPDLALKVFDTVDKEMPGDPQIALQRAMALFHLARFQDAQNLLSELEDRGYPAADLYFFLGCLAERLQRDATAMAHFKRAAMMEPDRYFVPAPADEKEVRNTIKKLISGAAGPLRSTLSHARLIIEALPTDQQLTESTPRLDPLALTMVDVEPLQGPKKAVQISAIHIFKKNIEKAIIGKEELEERLVESLTHNLSVAMHSDEEEMRKMMSLPPAPAPANTGELKQESEFPVGNG
ncbi:MAG: hypothetical protein NTX50_07065 [Candidatus Sumerlaeota bacterium]|nr:hypothetical protein [Candidatus Sumerlaeota bacterium]